MFKFNQGKLLYVSKLEKFTSQVEIKSNNAVIGLLWKPQLNVFVSDGSKKLEHHCVKCIELNVSAFFKISVFLL